MSSSPGDSYHFDTGDDPNTTPVTNEMPGGSDTNPLTDTPISDKTPTDTDQNPVTFDNPLSDTSPSDKSPTATNPTLASPISDRAAIVEVLLKCGPVQRAVPERRLFTGFGFPLCYFLGIIGL